ncbi:MAG: hypothetical protein OXN22_00250 [Deltaproteobacteria bacterium]|nr:hypothetical protein [Deltaproteobacteria bacterium]
MMTAVILIVVVLAALVAGFLAVTDLWVRTFKDGVRFVQAVKKGRREP